MLCQAERANHHCELRDPPHILSFFFQHEVWEQNRLYMTNGVGFHSSFITCQLASLKQLNSHQLIWTVEGKETISFYTAVCKIDCGTLYVFAEWMTPWEPQFFIMKNNGLVLCVLYSRIKMITYLKAMNRNCDIYIAGIQKKKWPNVNKRIHKRTIILLLKKKNLPLGSIFIRATKHANV